MARGGQQTPRQTPPGCEQSAWGLRRAAQSVFAGTASGRITVMRLSKSEQSLRGARLDLPPTSAVGVPGGAVQTMVSVPGVRLPGFPRSLENLRPAASASGGTGRIAQRARGTHFEPMACPRVPQPRAVTWASVPCSGPRAPLTPPHSPAPRVPEAWRGLRRCAAKYRPPKNALGTSPRGDAAGAGGRTVFLA